MDYSVILFDVDGVLLHAQGYKEALRDATRYFASLMGLDHIVVSDDLIADFESFGVTNEWESLPLCVGALLHAGLTENSSAQDKTVLETLANFKSSGVSFDQPDFVSIMKDALNGPQKHNRASHDFLAYFKNKSEAHWHPLFEELLSDIYDMQTPTTAIFQAHTLGVERFAQTYGHVPNLELKSYLLTHDRAALNLQTREQLLNWRLQASHGATIFTARPSHPPRNSQADVAGFPPEADLAVELLELESLPIIASGRLGWLAEQRQTLASDYIKPFPVHALAGIGAALSGDEVTSLQAAVELAENNRLLEPLANLQGQTLHVTVFEDSMGGIQATQKACEYLRDVGIAVEMQAIGVATETSKRHSLAKVGAHVVDDVNAGLAFYWQLTNKG